MLYLCVFSLEDKGADQKIFDIMGSLLSHVIILLSPYILGH